MTDDPFGTAVLRTAVLDAWAASPTRFREDANAEEDLRLGGYARTWFVELAQNAADAARAAGVPGRVRVVAEAGELRVANTGVALDGPGVAALASLRASAKRDGEAVGRFGVGFAAVLALTDAPRLVSSGGGVAFSASRTAEAVAALPGPATELARRGGELPILRLPWPLDPADPPPPSGYDTEVRLPLRPGLDAAVLLAAARAEAETLLLALPGLSEIVVDGTVLSRRDRPVQRGGAPPQSPDSNHRGAYHMAAYGMAADGAGPASRGPAVHEAVVTANGHESRWLLARRAGVLDAADIGTLAVEQRERNWSVCWALPLTADGRPAPLDHAHPGAAAWPGDQPGPAVDAEVLHAPTGTVERMSLPGRLVATVPLDPDRRHVRAGPVTDRVLAGAAAAYVDLVRAVDPPDRPVLLPAAGFPRSGVDGQVRDLVLGALRGARWLPGAGGAELAPGRAEWLDLPGAEALPPLLAESDAFPGLLAPVPGLAALSALDVDRLGPAALADRLLGVEMPPSWWQAVYAALAPAVDTVPGLADELRALPVPLVDAPDAPDAPEADPWRSPDVVDTPHGRGEWTTFGDHGGRRDGPGGGPRGPRCAPAGRVVPGPAAVLLPPQPPDPAVTAVAALGLPGLHVAHPAAVHPLLARLGATPADRSAVLDHPAVRAAVERSVDDADAGLDTGPLAAGVLGLVADRRPELAALALPAADGAVARADELMLPDAALRPLLADDVPLGVLDPAWAARFPRHVLTAAGVVDGFAVLADDDPQGPDHDLDDEEAWWDALDAPPARLVAVRDLDLVADDAWPAALALLAGERETREAILAGVPGGAPSYSAWWLARHARLHGHRPGHWRLTSAASLAALHDPLPPTACDEAVLTAIGVRAQLGIADPRAAADLLDRLADPARALAPALVAAAHAALAEAVRDGLVDPAAVDPPQRVRARDGSIVDVDVAVVLDRLWLAPVLPAGETVLGSGAGELVTALAELLDLPLASDVVAAVVEGKGRPARWADLPEVVLACAALDVEVPEGGLRVHDRLVVSVTRPPRGQVEVPAWRDDRGGWHAADPVRAVLGLLAC